MGAGIQSGLGPLPLPTSPAWLTSWLSLLLDTEGQPPDRLSGATLAVQREQQMDQLEHMMASLQQNRLVSAQISIITSLFHLCLSLYFRE